MMDHSSIKALKSALPRTWHAVLAGFNMPTPVQLKGIPAIMAGGPVLLIAPTATGKTESYAAPIAEKILAGPGPDRLTAWIVSPTRALVNDLARRLATPLAAMGLRLGRRTGERREISGADPPHVVVTTPESLDSILTRTPSMLSRARFLVLDDVHMLAGTLRGDQLACLVSRIRAISGDIQLIASSATVDDPKGIAGRYLGENAVIVQVPGDRNIEAEFVEGGPSGLASTLQRLSAKGDVRKVLSFVKRRADAERFFSTFKGRPPFGDSVFLHHGSLSRSRREAVERRMLTGTSGLCFATSTLEVGIDIGNIDLVVLAEPPPDVSSLLQRIGRGNRRTHVTRVCCMVGDEAQRLRYEHLIEAAIKGRLLGGSYHFFPSVLVQQCMGLLLQTPGKWITAKALASRMPGWLKQTGWLNGLSELLEHLARQAWLVPAGRGRYTVGEKLEHAFERGLVHTNIDSGPGGTELVDQDTLQVIGSVPRHAALGGPMLLGGRRLRISRALSPSKVLVADTGARAELKVPAGPKPLIHAGLARDFACFLGLPPDTAPAVRLKDGTVALFHFLGDLWGALLGALMEERTGAKSSGANAFCLLLKGLPPVFPLEVPTEEIRTMVIRHRVKLRRRIPEGPWAKHMPPEWRIRHLQDILDIEEFRKAAQAMVIQDPAPPALELALFGLISGLR